MLLFVLFLTLFSSSLSLVVEPTNSTTCVELFFEKMTTVNKVDIYFYDNFNEEIYVNGVKAYRINEGLLFSSKFIKNGDDFTEINSSVPFSYPLLLCDTRRPMTIFLDESIKIKFRRWITDDVYENI